MQAISTPLVEPALVLALLFVLVLVAPLAARAVRMPSIIGLIVAGIVIGPSALGLPEHAWRFDGVEYHGLLSFLKAGLQFATLISTVSPSYAREILDEAFGYGLASCLLYTSPSPRDS